VRVLIMNLGYPPNVMGGAELWVQTLAKELAGRGIKVGVVSLSQNGTDWQYDDEGVRAYFVHAHPMGIALLNPKRTLAQKLLWHALGEANMWISRKLGGVLEREKPDIVNTHSLLGLSVNAWHAVASRGIPVVHTLQDYQLLCPRGTMFRQGQPCARQCASCRLLTARRRRASAVPAAVVGISQFILNSHLAQGYFPAASKALIPNGFRARGTVSRRRLDAVGGPLRIGFIGRLHPTKGVELLIEALKRLRPGSYIAKLAGSGSPEYEARLRGMAAGLAVDFAGWVRRDEFYDQIDVLAVPSLYCEPQGMVLVEAASFGVPVIYSARGGLGEMGALFPGFLGFDPDRPDGLSEVLRPLTESRSSALRLAKSIGPVPSSFEIDRLIDQYCRLYEAALGGGAKPASYRVGAPSHMSPDS
jgi:glycosyltransferase involved in cell wall biosynthesis